MLKGNMLSKAIKIILTHEGVPFYIFSKSLAVFYKTSER